MNSKTVMICLEQLGIGGVETAVYNQAYTLKEKGYNVIIVARNGIYKQKLENYGIKCIDFEFALENKFDFEKTEMLKKVMRENDVCEVHIHQFPCILSAFKACIDLKIPYVAYIHVGLLTKEENVYDWYEKTYSVYNIAFKMFFENAYKIVAITDYAAEYNMKRYKIAKEKYIIICNSINFDLYNISDKDKDNDSTKGIDTEDRNSNKNGNRNENKNYLSDGKIKKFLLVSRISHEKLSSIKNAIDLYISYCDKTNIVDARLDILGDGEEIDEVKDYINQINTKKYESTFLGKSNDVAKYIKSSDVVFGLGRCILETIALKKLAIIAAYNLSATLVKSSNIKEACNNNFDGKNFKTSFYDLLIDELIKLDEISIKKIVDDNFEYVYNNLNAKKNVYIIHEGQDLQKIEENIEKYRLNIDYEFLNFVFYYEKQNQQNIEIIENLKNKNLDLNNIIAKKISENTSLKLDNDKLVVQNNNLSKELNDLYNSKRWKYSSKIAKIFGK